MADTSKERVEDWTDADLGRAVSLDKDLGNVEMRREIARRLIRAEQERVERKARSGPLDPRFRRPLTEQNIRDAVGLIGSDSILASTDRKEEAARALAREIFRLRARQREGDGEPVAWRVRYRRIGRGWTWFRLHADKAKAVQDVEHLIQNYKSVSYAEAVPLYTEPPAEEEEEDDGP